MINLLKDIMLSDNNLIQWTSWELFARILSFACAIKRQQNSISLSKLNLMTFVIETIWQSFTFAPFE